MADTFDPATFLNQTVDEAMDTKIVPCPAGEYPAVADKVDIKTWASKDGSSSGIKLVILWDIQDPNVNAITMRNPTKVKQEQMIDLTESGQIDLGKGRNVGLGRIREALGLNTPGEPFSFNMLQGRTAKVNVTHRVDGPDIYDQVKSIAPLS